MLTECWISSGETVLKDIDNINEIEWKDVLPKQSFLGTG